MPKLERKRKKASLHAVARLRGWRNVGYAFLALALPLGGCASVSGVTDSVTSIFEEEEKKLPGERISVVAPDTASGLAEIETAQPVEVSTERENADWSQPGGVASNAPGHLAFAGRISRKWRADAGQGSSSDGRIIAKPVIVGNRVFTLDTEARVRAFSTGSGKMLWEASLVPESEEEEAGFGGGLAFDAGKLFAATGFGTVVALNPSSGKVLWTKRFELPFRMSPTAADGRVFAVNSESQLFALSAEDGRELWNARGLPEAAVVLSNASPAVSGSTVVVPYPSGEMLAFDVSNGQPKWAENLTRTRPGMASKNVGDTARPVIAGGVVYAVSGAGRLVATDIQTGSRRWSVDVASNQTPWVSGEAVFVVDRSGKLVAIKRDSGDIAWVAELPKARLWNGPVLAGGKLWLVSSKGLMVAVDARTGKLGLKRDLDTDIYVAPVVASRQMYVLTDSARLLALN
jgi:outer membrane protein assembly factor BamB